MNEPKGIIIDKEAGIIAIERMMFDKSIYVIFVRGKEVRSQNRGGLLCLNLGGLAHNANGSTDVLRDAYNGRTVPCMFYWVEEEDEANACYWSYRENSDVLSKFESIIIQDDEMEKGIWEHTLIEVW